MSSEISNVTKICSCLTVLTSEINIVNSADDARKHHNIKEAFANDLQRNIHLTFQKLNKSYPDIYASVAEYIDPCLGHDCETCDYMTYLQLSLVLLRVLKNALLDEIEYGPNIEDASKACAPRGVLSISQTNILQRSLQFSVALGILPNLLRGIGIPLSRRLKHAIILEHFTSESTLHQKHVQLAECLDTLIVCLDCEAMQSIILTYHGTDMLAAMLQICYAPIKKIENLGAVSAPPVGPSKVDYSMTEEAEIINMMLSHRAYFKSYLPSFLKQMNSSLLLWELLLFQGIPFKSEDSDNVVVTKTPNWLRKICNQLMTDIILQRQGIIDICQVVLDKAYDTDMSNGTFDTVRIEAVARVITYNPVRHISLTEYIQRLTGQVFMLFRIQGTSVDNLFHYLGASIILQFTERDMKSAQQYFWVKLLKPLWNCVRQNEHPQSAAVVPELEITTCIEDLSRMFVFSENPLSRRHIKMILPFSNCLFNMFFTLLRRASHLKTTLRELLLHLFNGISDEEALHVLHSVSFPNSAKSGIYLCRVSFVGGDEEGGIAAVPYLTDEVPNEIVRFRAILEILSELQNKNINRSYILLVLKEFCNFHLESQGNIMCEENVKNSILFNALLQELSEWNVDIGEALMSNVSEVIDIIVTLLVSVCDRRNSITNYYEKTLWVVLMILNSILENDDQFTSSDWTSLKRCLPCLEQLKTSEIDTNVKGIVLSLMTHINTHGVVWKDQVELLKDTMAYCLETNTESDEQTERTDQLVDKIKRLCNIGTEPANATRAKPAVERKPPGKKANPKKCAAKPLSTPSKAGKASKKAKEKSLYETAVADIAESSIPMLGHKLISLRTLLSTKDEETLQHKEELLKLFLEYLEDDDSYIYLAAIRGLVQLAEVDHELVLPVILNNYQNSTIKHGILKLGEVLVNICKSLGDMIHKYKDQLLHVYLTGTQCDDPQIRSSNLSNLGQVCMCLKFNISSQWLQEILVCVLSFLKTDKNLEVRRCAVMVIFLLIKGVGRDMIKVFGNEIKEIYHQLKLTYDGVYGEINGCAQGEAEGAEVDDGRLQLHAQLALEEITDIMKELLCANIPHAKEIRIMQ